MLDKDKAVIKQMRRLLLEIIQTSNYVFFRYIGSRKPANKII